MKGLYEMKSNTINLPKEVLFIIQKLNNAGFTAEIVGGCVRDSLLGITPHDWDICTSATPQQMRMLFYEFPIIDTGSKYGTLTININEQLFECTTYRTESGYFDNRHPENISFCQNITEDLSRRDFTINAIAFHPIANFIDPFSGELDLKNGIIRCVGDPYDRFKEDALRILRAIRFQAYFGFSIEEKTEGAMTACASALKNISKERIRDELIKIITSPYASLALVAHLHILNEIIPSISKMDHYFIEIGTKKYSLADYVLNSLDKCPNNEILRLAIFLSEISKTLFTEQISYNCKSSELASIILKELRFSNKTISSVYNILHYYPMVMTFETKEDIKKHLRKIGTETFESILTFAEIKEKSKFNAVNKATIRHIHKLYKLYKKIIKNNECYKLDMLNISGQELLELNIPQGRSIGLILDSLLIDVIKGEVKNNKEELLSLAKKYAQHL